jgi:hypothetical protein
MAMWRRRRRISGASIGFLVALTTALVSARGAAAQEHRPEPEAMPEVTLLREVAKRVALDPTTYAPTVVVYTARQLDWSSSQTLFAFGYLEANPRYTTSGLPGDTPVAYAVGNRRIASDTVGLLGRSIANNAASAAIEHVLIERAPRHRRLIRALGWVERVAFASYWSHRLSRRHFGQWRENERVARELGAR